MPAAPSPAPLAPAAHVPTAHAPAPAVAARAATAPAFSLAAERRTCPSCKKDPGIATDYCGRCGADQKTGVAGPNATVCQSCARVVLRGTAVCPRCAAAIDDVRRTRGNRGAAQAASWGVVGAVERAVLVLGAVGIAYFLVYRPFLAPKPPEARPAEEGPSAAMRAEALAKEGDRKGTLAALEDAARKEKHDPAVDAALALALRQAGRAKDALAPLARARAAKPDDRTLASLEADLRLDTGDGDGAARALEAIPEGARDDAYWRARARVARLRSDAGAETAAIAQVKEKTPAEARPLVLPLIRKGADALEIDKTDEAAAAFREACKLDPTSALAHARLGQALLRGGNAGEARDEFKTAVTLAPGDAGARLGLAIALERTGDRAGAARELGEFIEKAGGDPGLARDVERARARKRALEGR